MATSPTMRKLLALVHEYVAEPAPADSDAAARRDLDYFDRILSILGIDLDVDRGPAAAASPGEYRVRWEIDLNALSALAAARRAREVQLQAESLATVFDVVLRADTSAEPDWSQAETIDLTAHRSDHEVLDEIAHLLRADEPPTVEDIAHIAHLVQLTGRDLAAPGTLRRERRLTRTWGGPAPSGPPSNPHR
jgi:hypothetical protein